MSALTSFNCRTDRPDPVDLLVAGSHDRLARLLPIRYARMSASPFAFLRGAAAVMAADLGGGADTGLRGHICGDAHAANFGFYASPERRLVLDVNDFDETTVGPWDWDLKRLVASLVCAGREAGATEEQCRVAAVDCARSYRRAMVELAHLPLLEGYYLTTEHSTLEHYGIDDLVETFDRVRKKAKKNTNRRVVAKITGARSDQTWGFIPDPPKLTRLPGDEADQVVAGLAAYQQTLDEEIRALVSRYAVVDVAHRVVGLGSIGYRSYVVLLRGNGEDPLILQVKQARESVLTPHLPRAAGQFPAVPKHQGERVVRGQRWMQTVSDVLLGWTTIDGRQYIVRQFRDMKGSIEPTSLGAAQLDDYARITGVVLARAHAQSMDPRTLAGYCEGGYVDAVPQADTLAGTEFDAAFAHFAVAYADHTESDHASLLAAIRTGRLPSEAEA